MPRVMGQAGMDATMRMYLLPGVAHCGGGEGHPNTDLVSRIVDWVEGGAAPDAVTTYRTDTANNVTRARPVYPYPAVAKYSGTGDLNAAANWVRGAPLTTEQTPDWAGADWFNPYPAAPL